MTNRFGKTTGCHTIRAETAFLDEAAIERTDNECIINSMYYYYRDDDIRFMTSGTRSPISFFNAKTPEGGAANIRNSFI